ncbi:ATP synthase F1 subcomplex epsilon subunit [Dongia mobilis]|uniref:ATP synthase epsilon chain n=1 Tax=Dongia mobilis TaxID=578943 RepID=A0A4R6X2M2_9PROT|nr:F0F1 ATP synthase subunit epsilon [Dongia mobilis]TDQ86332.1 ATP synthase F1 subcomplex epsilon subunit [Dongia mobilis]
MADQVHFELVSPERLLFSANVAEIVIPGVEGDFAVLAGHSNLISTLRPGVIHILETGAQVTDRIFVEGGFAEVNAEGCTVLAERAARVADIDRNKAEQALADAREDLQDAKSEIDRAAAAQLVEIAEARIAALGTSTY